MISGLVIALIIALIGIAMVVLKIAEHFKGEDQRWYGMLFRTVLYVFAIGFCMLAIGAINQMFELNITMIDSLSAITSSVNLISKLMLFIIIAVGIFAIVYIIERLLLKIKMNKDKEEEEWNK
jgi:phosphotransferase system  glucose/maltose/N-acetylglucosamine-specific IIC component